MCVFQNSHMYVQLSSNPVFAHNISKAGKLTGHKDPDPFTRLTIIDSPSLEYVNIYHK